MLEIDRQILDQLNLKPVKLSFVQHEIIKILIMKI